MKYRYIIGIDEVGRGPLAGPVTVCAAALPMGVKLDPLPNGVKLNDSKKLTAKSREAWAKKLKERGVTFAISSVTPRVIDRINISKAANRAAERSLLKLAGERENSVAVFPDFFGWRALCRRRTHHDQGRWEDQRGEGCIDSCEGEKR